MDRQRRRLLSSIQAGRARLLEALAELDDEAMLDRVDEEWTRKDVLAHLGAWEQRVVDLFAILRAGEEPADAEETDALNARLQAAHRDLPLDLVRRSEDEAWQRLLAVVEGAQDAELFDGERFAWTGGDPFADWIHANTDEHYQEHLDQLTRPAVGAVAEATAR
jgi:hypothetical protein